jgi:hypothetical protein
MIEDRSAVQRWMAERSTTVGQLCLFSLFEVKKVCGQITVDAAPSHSREIVVNCLFCAETSIKMHAGRYVQLRIVWY